MELMNMHNLSGLWAPSCKAMRMKTKSTITSIFCLTTLLVSSNAMFQRVVSNTMPSLAVARTSLVRPVLKEKGYDIVNYLGTGGLGVVMKVNRSGYGEFAMKVLRKTDYETRDGSASLLEERNCQRILSAKCPYIPSLVETFQDKDRLFMTMENVNGQDLYSLMVQREECIPQHVAKLWMAEILVALQDSQEEGIVHRDLKPENLIVGLDGHIRVIDFGFAKKLEEDEMLNSNCGTSCYKSPEVVKEEDYRFEPDMWSLGVVMANIISGCSMRSLDEDDDIKKHNHDDNYTFPAPVWGREGGWFELILLLSEGYDVFGAPEASPALNLLGGLLTYEKENRMGCANHPEFNSPKALLDNHAWFGEPGTPGRISYDILKEKNYESITNWDQIQAELKELGITSNKGFTNPRDEMEIMRIEAVMAQDGDASEWQEWDWSL